MSAPLVADIENLIWIEFTKQVVEKKNVRSVKHLSIFFVTSLINSTNQGHEY